MGDSVSGYDTIPIQTVELKLKAIITKCLDETDKFGKTVQLSLEEKRRRLKLIVLERAQQPIRAYLEPYTQSTENGGHLLKHHDINLKEKCEERLKLLKLWIERLHKRAVD